MAIISKNQLVRLQKKLVTDDAIGKQFGISRQAVHQLRVKYGIAAIAHKNDARNAAIIKSASNGIPCEHIAKKFKLSLAQTYRIIREAAL
jgi:DNA invertase Pin-like site-specific DNA recombinase